MKQTATTVTSLINAARAARDAPLAFAECFTFITTTGTQYTWTNVDYDVSFNGSVFLASGPLVVGLKYKGSVGLEVDKQQITIAARPTDVVNGAPFIIALRDGAFDGAPVFRDRVFLSSPAGTVVGGVRMFQGRISTVDSVGRTQATVTVASDLVILDYDMPKISFRPRACMCCMTQVAASFAEPFRSTERSPPAPTRTQSTSLARVREMRRARSSSLRAPTPTSARRSEA